jgi:ParB family transcriptional regulator, chromosome partitioning protein
MQAQTAPTAVNTTANIAVLTASRKKAKHADEVQANATTPEAAPLPMAKEPQGEIIKYPHNQCVISILNKRTVPHTDEEIEKLAALILPHGVAQNLIGFRQKRKGRETGIIEIVAGGGRYKGVALLVSRGQARPEYPMPVLVVSEEDAIAYSLVENMGRKAMHLAEIIDAMKQMIDDQGKHPFEIGAAFGYSTRDTSRLLALAAISPRLFAMFRNNEIKYEIAVQFTLTDDHELQEKVWNGLPKYNRENVHYLRRLILNQKIDAKKDAVARFVGAKAYEAAGGAITRDLFSEGDDGYMSDPALLEQLATAKLEKRAEAIRAEGWKWVEVSPRATSQHLNSFDNAPEARREPTEEEQTAIDGVQEEVTKLQAEIEACEDEDKAQELYERQSAVESKWEDLEAQLMEVPPQLRTLSGVVLSVDDNGKVQVSRGLIRPDDRKAARAAAKALFAGDADAKGATILDKTPKKPEREHSDRLTRQLTAHRTLALQAMVAKHPNIALVVLTHKLARDVFYSDLHSQESTLQLRSDPFSIERDTPDIEKCRAWGEMKEQRTHWKGRIKSRGKKKSLFAWLLELPLEELLNLMAFCVADNVSALEQREDRNKAGDELAQALGFEFADWWTPTADNYFGQISKARMVEVVTEAVSAEVAQPLQAMKKAEAAKAAEQAVGGARWIPKFLRIKK